jgi:hypothetical protein
MFLIKNNLSYLYFVIILGILLKGITFVLGDLKIGFASVYNIPGFLFLTMAFLICW